ncbi:hypothetical protein [Providencia alcalifaciens]|uniref:hypothetical protein n=1 Tax=Providencia alcalifaciens TaxID=126385 RepID=UPI0012B65EF9|nr:hypothetical protein [Providencia alcalifaciens]MTC64194.1 hypothetical protein [Providencia alcalifaciens]
MPIVPTYKEQQVSSSPLPNNGFSVQSSPEHFGAGFGQVAEQYTGLFAEAKQRANVALAQDASLQLRQKANELMNDPRNGLLAMQGKNAIGKGYEFEQAFDNAAGEIAGTLQDDAIKSMFAQQAKEMRLQFSSQANKHEMGQIKAYEQDQFQATLSVNAESAASLYGDNNAYVSANKQVFQQIEEFGFSHGWSDEQILAKKQEFKTTTAKRAIENQLGSDYMQFMQQNGEPSDNGGISRSSTYYGGSVGSTQGMIQQGNINLLNRPTVKNKDGSISTVRTISIGTDQGEVLIPTVSDDGRLLSDDEAIALFEETGNHLGVFDNPDDATAYAESLHNQQEKTYAKNGSGARGVRNNNPGNIRKSKDVWVGQTGNDGSFVTFATPAHGIRATGKNLLSYARQGYVTPEQIITRWAPPEDDNDTEGYIKFVSDYLNVPRDTALDLTDLDTLTRLSMAIMIQENGQGEVSKLSNDDISSGIQSALGLVSLPSSPNAPKRLTGSVAFDALDESDQAKYLKQAEQMDKQRQQQLQTELGTTISDSYAAWENGLDAPNAPSEKTIISAFGYDKGTAMIADMREAKRYSGLISAAKDMTPQAQRSLLNSIMPDPSESNYASKMQRWEKFGKFVDSNIKAQDKVFSANRLQLSIQNNFPLDPNDKSNQDAADNYFANNIESSFNIRDENSLNAVAEISSRTGIIPSQIKSKLVTGSTSRNPELVIPMAKMYGQIFDNNPSAINGLSTDAMAYYGKIYDLTRSGMDSEKAIDIAYNLTYEQNDRTKAIIAEQMRDKKYSKEREKAAQGNINSFFALGGFSSPNITKPSVSNREYMRDYQTLYDANFASTGGDPDLAKKMTDAQVKKTWGVTSINGKDEVMRYAPEAVYGTSESGAGNWIIGQWQEEQKNLKSKMFGGMPGDAEFVLVPDAVTARDYSYAIMLKQTGSDNIPVFTPFLGDNGMPSRFKPEQSSSPMYREVMDKRQKTYQEAKKEREILDGNAKPEPIDYGFSNTLNTMFGRE